MMPIVFRVIFTAASVIHSASANAAQCDTYDETTLLQVRQTLNLKSQSAEDEPLDEEAPEARVVDQDTSAISEGRGFGGGEPSFPGMDIDAALDAVDDMSERDAPLRGEALAAKVIVREEIKAMVAAESVNLFKISAEVVMPTATQMNRDKTAGRTVGQLHVVDQSKFPMAAALDGTPPVYYTRRATRSESDKKWVIYLNGGDYCGEGDTEEEQLHDCYLRSLTPFGSSSKYLKQVHHGIDKYHNLIQGNTGLDKYSPLLDSSSKSNPLTHDWNLVFIPYLDGGYYAGSRRDTPVVNGTSLHFRGAYNLEAIVASLASEHSLRRATDVVLAGCSTGGVALIAGGDFMHSLLKSEAPGARLSAFADSAYFLNVSAEPVMRKDLRVHHIGRTLSAACLQAKASTPWECMVPETAALFVERLPLFLSQSRYDSTQLMGANVDKANVSEVNAYGSKLLSAMTSWATPQRREADSDRSRGAFVDGCTRHGNIIPGIVTPGGLTPASAFKLFYYGDLDAQKFHTPVVAQSGTYPCRRCCDPSGTMSEAPPGPLGAR